MVDGQDGRCQNPAGPAASKPTVANQPSTAEFTPTAEDWGDSPLANQSACQPPPARRRQPSLPRLPRNGGQQSAKPSPASRRQPSLPRLPRTRGNSLQANHHQPAADSRVYPDCRGPGATVSKPADQSARRPSPRQLSAYQPPLPAKPCNACLTESCNITLATTSPREKGQRLHKRKVTQRKTSRWKEQMLQVK